MNLITTNTEIEVPKLTPRERAEWEITRAQGKNRFLLLPGLPIVLGVTGVAAIEKLLRHGLSLDTLTGYDFISSVGISFYVTYAANCFIQMLRWQKNEYLFLRSDGEEQTPPAE